LKLLSKSDSEVRPGDVLVVVRLDRLARSVSHLLEVIERLEDGGAHFRSLREPIDTSTPQGMFSLQVLGAVAQLERAPISERTKAGIKAAPRSPRRRRRETASTPAMSLRRWTDGFRRSAACGPNTPGRTSSRS